MMKKEKNIWVQVEQFFTWQKWGIAFVTYIALLSIKLMAIDPLEKEWLSHVMGAVCDLVSTIVLVWFGFLAVCILKNIHSRERYIRNIDVADDIVQALGLERHKKILENHEKVKIQHWDRYSYEHYEFSYKIFKKIEEKDTGRKILEYSIVNPNNKKTCFEYMTQYMTPTVSIVALMISTLSLLNKGNVEQTVLWKLVFECLPIIILICVIWIIMNVMSSFVDNTKREQDKWFYIDIIKQVLSELK